MTNVDINGQPVYKTLKCHSILLLSNNNPKEGLILRHKFCNLIRKQRTFYIFVTVFGADGRLGDTARCFSIH